ncbi:hypothetical protein AKJ09_02937 [Labilithrix luteola]|uniref:Uncharacterized protein n=1 Tax=Labilithrix luteola TaxID=1391654 RepID=A0A0K1PRX0_9BACT|nr:hypothetical protein [Labilithrix luteola]AKU96273.1 hypothetical protein AKJ09_02937 [Labilithrix luteola]
MRKAAVSMVLLLAACGGQVAEPSPNAQGASSTNEPPSSDTPSVGAPAGRTGPESVASDVGIPSALALSSTSAVFTTRNTFVGGELVEAGALFVADKRVGPALMISVDRQGATYDALAIDEHDAFVGTSDGRLVRVPLMGGEPATVADIEASPVALSLSGDYVYFARETGEVGRVAKAGGAPEALATVEGAVRGVEADANAVYVATGPTDAKPAAGGIVRVGLDTHAPELLASSGEPCALIRDGEHLFWTSRPASAGGPAMKGEVRKLSLEGNAVATVAAGTFTACAIASDDQNLWFATTAPAAAFPVRSGDGSAAGSGLMRAPIAGGDPVVVDGAGSALAQPGAVAVDATHVYWLTDKAVLRLAK